MTDEMPLDVFRKALHLPCEFLFLAFTEEPLPLTVGSLDIFDRMELADGNQLHTIRKSPEHFVQILRYVIHNRRVLSLQMGYCSNSGFSSASVFLPERCSKTSMIFVSVMAAIS